MTRQEVIKLLGWLRSAYPNTKIVDAAGMVSVWEMEFAEDDANKIFMAARWYIHRHEFFPSPNEIRKCIDAGEIAYSQTEQPKIEPPKPPVRKIEPYCTVAQQVLNDGTTICPYFNGEICDGTKADYELCWVKDL